MAQKRPVPAGYSSGIALFWWLKLGIKLLLTRLPLSVSQLQEFGGFRNSPNSNEFEREISGLVRVWQKYKNSGSKQSPVFLEIGAGDSVCRALIAASLGASRTYLIDHQDTATLDIEHYKRANDALARNGLSKVLKGHEQSRTEILKSANAIFLSDGLASLRTIETGSIDIIASAAVLEHLPLKQFDEFFSEFCRVSNKDSLSFHGIDFHDHFRGKLNHLRFSKQTWEKWFGLNSGFYTNRIGRTEMYSKIEEAGFWIEEIERLEWEEAPLSSKQVHTDLDWTNHDALVCSASIFCYIK